MLSFDISILQTHLSHERLNTAFHPKDIWHTYTNPSYDLYIELRSLFKLGWYTSVYCCIKWSWVTFYKKYAKPKRTH